MQAAAAAASGNMHCEQCKQWRADRAGGMRADTQACHATGAAGTGTAGTGKAANHVCVPFTVRGSRAAVRTWNACMPFGLRCAQLAMSETISRSGESQVASAAAASCCESAAGFAQAGKH